MSHRNPLQRALRLLLMVLATAGPLVWPLPIPLPAVAMGALLAYEGPTRRVLFSSVVLLTVVELFGALDLGILSLPVLAAALMLAVAGRVLSLTPWADTDGWHVGDFIRTVLLAVALAAGITAGSVLVGSLMYDLGMSAARLPMALAPHILLTMAPCSAVIVIILRRIDVPFRHRIRFGM